MSVSVAAAAGPPIEAAAADAEAGATDAAVLGEVKKKKKNYCVTGRAGKCVVAAAARPPGRCSAVELQYLSIN